MCGLPSGPELWDASMMPRFALCSVPASAHVVLQGTHAVQHLSHTLSVSQSLWEPCECCEQVTERRTGKPETQPLRVSFYATTTELVLT